jgi:predicted naringenin-chalcone synthase
MKGWLAGDDRVNRIVDCIYDNSSIEKRHTVISEPDAFFRKVGNGGVEVPTTKYRNDRFAEEATKMSVDLAGRAIAGCDHLDARRITDLITVSCTGFYNPGFDFEIVKQLHLPSSVRRYNIGFMGCYAAFPALRLARTICLAEPGAVVLVVAIELCTLHVQLTHDLDSIQGAALFADGGAAVVVSAEPPGPEQDVLEVEHFESTVIGKSEGDMAWTIGDKGFEMVLSKYIPRIIESNISEIVIPALARQGMEVSDIDHWAVHPGGKAILDRIESSLGLRGRLSESRGVLREFGNMSSATVLFVLKRILEKPLKRAGESVFSLAFGPGLTVEMGFLKKVCAGKKPAGSSERGVASVPEFEGAMD